jgi:hypothetical protein
MDISSHAQYLSFTMAFVVITCTSACDRSDPKGIESADAPVEAAPPVTPAITPDYAPSAVEGMVRIDNKSYFYSAAKWANPSVPVCWESTVPSTPERDWVRSAINTSWNAAGSRLKFIGFGNCAANAVGIRIDVRDRDANDGPHTRGLGNMLDGVPNGMVLNFTFKTWSQTCAANETQREACIRSIAVHEFGHAAGFSHEQNRPDTPGECAKRAQGTDGDLMLTPWDLESVMNYCNPIYSNNGVLSTFDKQGLRDSRAYGVP